MSALCAARVVVPVTPAKGGVRAKQVRHRPALGGFILDKSASRRFAWSNVSRPPRGIRPATRRRRRPRAASVARGSRHGTFVDEAITSSIPLLAVFGGVRFPRGFSSVAECQGARTSQQG
jgi:hypothetical protein